MGGLYDGLRLIFSLLLAPLGSYNYLSLLLSSLATDGQTRKPSHNASRSTQSKCQIARDQVRGRKPLKQNFCIGFLAHYLFRCLISSQKRKTVNKAVRQLERQLDLVGLIKSHIALKYFIKARSSRVERFFLRNSHQALLLASDDSSCDSQSGKGQISNQMISKEIDEMQAIEPGQ